MIIAHSQGGAVLFAALSRGYISENSAKYYVGLSPVTYLQNQKSLLLSALAKLGGAALLRLFGNTPFSLSPNVLKSFLGALCTFTPSLCTDVSASLFGTPVSSNVNFSRVPVYASSWPDQTSVRNMAHWLQNTKSGLYQDFTGGLYNVSKIGRNVNVTIFCGGRDLLAGKKEKFFN